MSFDPKQVKSLFLAAAEITDTVERMAFLERECAGDTELLARINELLIADTNATQAAATGEFTPSQAVSFELNSPGEVSGAVIAGRYQLIEQIGQGGMGAVWKGKQTEPIKRTIAIKLIRVDLTHSKSILKRFEAERQAIALMDHPNIAKLLDAGATSSGSPFFVMELVKGLPLSEYCDLHHLDVKQRLELFMTICSAVQHAHQKGIIHRDLKPTNILVENHDGKPVPKVIDFGLSKATSGIELTDQSLSTAFGSVLGTPLYMAPEQATFNALDIDTRSDIYALGVILYELLTGTTPLTKETMRKVAIDEMLRLIREEETPKPSSRLSSLENIPNVAANRQTEPQLLGRFIKGDLDWIVMKALAKERDRRYETANGLAKDIERFLHHEPVSAGPPGKLYRVSKFIHRNRGVVLSAGLLLFALIAGIVGTTWGLIRAEERRQQAEKNLAYAKKGNEILGSVFASLDPQADYATVGELRGAIRDNLAKAVKELEGSAIGDPLVVAEMQNTLGLSLIRLGEQKLAISLFTKARDTQSAILGTNHRDTLVNSGNLGGAYMDVNDFEQAIPLLRETYQSMKANFGASHLDT